MGGGGCGNSFLKSNNIPLNSIMFMFASAFGPEQLEDEFFVVEPPRGGGLRRDQRGDLYYADG